MSRNSESPSQPQGSLPEEQVIALRWIERTSERFFNDPEICTWVRNQFLYENVTLDTLAAKFLEGDWVRGEYKDLSERYNIVRNSFHRLRLELLTPEEIVDLNRKISGKASLKSVRTRGDIPWQEDYLDVLRTILSEPGAKKERLNLQLIAREFSRITGRRVDERQMSRYIQRMRERGSGGPSEELTPSQRKAAVAARAQNLARGALLSSPENNQVMQMILNIPGARSVGLNYKYILGKFADITGEVTTRGKIRDAIAAHGLLTEEEKKELELDSTPDVEPE